MNDEYSEAVTALAIAAIRSNEILEGITDENLIQMENDEIQLTIEATCDVFGKSLERVEDDVLDAMERLPLEDMDESERLAKLGRLN